MSAQPLSHQLQTWLTQGRQTGQITSNDVLAAYGLHDDQPTPPALTAWLTHGVDTHHININDARQALGYGPHHTHA